ncbi:hypothetical protein EGW08_011828 [Elysia chlorotica]|uniref:Uncharacterized protein n=1 Tax=Elysia chlorotica TaxID=188477 RepID=A0A433TFV5_ELYCH|nr:hypothetical protein EGW08_011828 [Elysia chlorotica]
MQKEALPNYARNQCVQLSANFEKICKFKKSSQNFFCSNSPIQKKEKYRSWPLYNYFLPTTKNNFFCENHFFFTKAGALSFSSFSSICKRCSDIAFFSLLVKKMFSFFGSENSRKMTLITGSTKHTKN